MNPRRALRPTCSTVPFRIARRWLAVKTMPWAACAGLDFARITPARIEITSNGFFGPGWPHPDFGVRWLDTWLDTALAYGLFSFPNGVRKTVKDDKEERKRHAKRRQVAALQNACRKNNEPGNKAS